MVRQNYFFLVCFVFFHLPLMYGQLDQCRRQPHYVQKMGFSPGKSYLSTSERHIMGVVLMESDQPGNPNARITKRAQKESWKNKGFLGAISTDEFGNSYILPTAKVNTLYNKPEFQNSIYRLDSETGELNVFIDLPYEVKPGAQNPFGLLGSFYDCTTKQLFVSSVAGSDYNVERGKIYVVDVNQKTHKVIYKNKDFYGLAVHMQYGKKILYLASARSGDLYSLTLDPQLNPVGELKKELSIDGLGPRGDDRIRKIRFSSNGQMILNTVLFYYNLTAPSQDQQSTFVYEWDNKLSKWVLKKIE